MTVDELISKWTPKERENLKELIKESQEREKRIQQAEKSSLRGITRITDNLIGWLVERAVKEWSPYSQ